MSSNQIEFDESFLREARIGLMVVTVLMAVFVYVAFGRLSGWNASETNRRGYRAVISENRSEATIPDQTSESRVALIPGHTELPESDPEVQVATAIETTQIEDTAGDFVVPTVATLPSEIKLPASEIDTPSKSSGESKAKRIPAKKDSESSSDRSTGGKGAFDFSFWKKEASQERLVGGESQQEVAPPKKQKESNKKEDGKSQWNLRLPSLTPAKPTPKRAAEPSAGKQQVDAPQLKTASSSSFIPGSGFDKLPKTAPARNAGVPAIPASAKSAGMPKANQPSPALGEFPGAAPLAVVPASTKVEKGEGFWLVAQRIYGDGRFFDALYQANRKRVKSFNEVPAGTEILTPSINELRQRYPYLCPRKVYKTKKGETLFEIASEQLGQASRYVEILKLNYARLPKGVKQDTPLQADIQLELPRQK